MPRYTLVALGAFVLLTGLVEAFDVTKTKTENIFLTEEDVVKDEPAGSLRANVREYRFIGDLVIGDRLADETVFRRSVDIANPTNQVYSTTISLNVERGKIHFLSATNERNSYAVGCDEPYSLGHSKISFNVRVPPSSKSQLWLLVAAH
ncbi:uncharacterized protein LOC106650898 [Trichogramma pretiosum]|uniref:Uncharacterized protein n=1 Tax=Trichogramma kaykai TaxID=54128 RepID=A0ABD2VVB5_9HYME|nr:uncharacterized protein LOC106650898 [Trichogramma pretiosum]